jgi:RNA-binding protein
MQPLTNPEIRKLKARAQRLEPMFKVGKAGLSDAFVGGLSDALALHELIKVKFAEFKEEKKTLAPALAEKTSSHLIMRVGNVAVYFRPKPEIKDTL